VSDRKAALEMALKQIEKQFGKGSIMKMGEQTETRISTVPSGSLALDAALGVGGYPRGRIMVLKAQVKQQLHFTQLRKFKQKADKLHLSMRNMRLILPMHKN
jgi:hypothetical protein